MEYTFLLYYYNNFLFIWCAGTAPRSSMPWWTWNQKQRMTIKCSASTLLGQGGHMNAKLAEEFHFFGFCSSKPKKFVNRIRRNKPSWLSSPTSPSLSCIRFIVRCISCKDLLIVVIIDCGQYLSYLYTISYYVPSLPQRESVRNTCTFTGVISLLSEYICITGRLKFA